MASEVKEGRKAFLVSRLTATATAEMVEAAEEPVMDPLGGLAAKRWWCLKELRGLKRLCEYVVVAESLCKHAWACLW